MSYICENTVAQPKSCDFRSGRIILQQEIVPEQMAKLLNDGQTDLLTGFVSQRTHRPFKAYLALGKEGKVSFKFEETAVKASSAKKKATTASKTKSSAKAADTAREKTAVKKTAARKTSARKAKTEE